MIDVVLPLYIVGAIVALVFSVGMLADPGEHDVRRPGAAGVLTFWAWPIWVAIFAACGVWHLIKIAAGKA